MVSLNSRFVHHPGTTKVPALLLGLTVETVRRVCVGTLDTALSSYFETLSCSAVSLQLWHNTKYPP